MGTLDLKNTETSYGNGNSGIVIKKYIHGLEGGRVLDWTDYPEDWIQEGHGIMVENGNYRPLPITGRVTAGYVMAGVARSLTTKENPSTGVMTMGVINTNALKYSISATELGQLQALGVQTQAD
jgi:hypothetical protein